MAQSVLGKNNLFTLIYRSQIITVYLNYYRRLSRTNLILYLEMKEQKIDGLSSADPGLLAQYRARI